VKKRGRPRQLLASDSPTCIRAGSGGRTVPGRDQVWKVQVQGDRHRGRRGPFLRRSDGPGQARPRSDWSPTGRTSTSSALPTCGETRRRWQMVAWHSTVSNRVSRRRASGARSQGRWEELLPVSPAPQPLFGRVVARPQPFRCSVAAKVGPAPPPRRAATGRRLSRSPGRRGRHGGGAVSTRPAGAR
jgi:hypothetical protein